MRGGWVIPVMIYAALILVAGGIVALIWGAMQKFKAGRLASAPFVQTGQAASNGAGVANPKGAISVQGTVQVAQPLRSPVSGTECLYYELEVIGKWKDGDTSKSKSYVDQKMAAQFFVNDGSGAVRVDAAGGGDFEQLETKFDETRKEGFFADLKSAVGKGESIVFGHYAFNNPPMSKADEFRCVERVLPLQPSLYVCGKSDQNAITAPSWTSLILSNKSRDELLGATAKAAKSFLVGGAAASAAGTILGVVSNLV